MRREHEIERGRMRKAWKRDKIYADEEERDK